MIVPLQWFVDNPFENWTRIGAQLTQSVFLFVDFTTPLDPLREELKRLVGGAPEWDKRVAKIDVVDTTERAMKLRVLVTAASSGLAFDLGCRVREGLIVFLAARYPAALPQLRMGPATAVPDAA
jgi:hypothetical protein